MSNLMFYPDAANYLSKSVAAVKMMVSRKRKDSSVDIPLPKNKKGNRPYWIESEFKAFYAKNAETRGRKRKIVSSSVSTSG